MTSTTRRSWACTGLLMAITAGAVIAQPAEPTIRSVTFSTIKADRVGDYLAAVKEIAALTAKAGSARYSSTWASLSGPREFARVTYRSKWAEFDVVADPKMQPVAGQYAALLARIFATVESSRTVHQVLDSELSLPLPTGDPQPLARVLRSWVRADQVAAYRALTKSDVLPAYKRAGTKTYSVARTRFGGSTFEFTSVTGLDKWAELDSEVPLIKAMGGQAATFSGLAGLGDLMATCMSPQSRNRYVGEQLGKGRKLPEILTEMNMVAEGVKTAETVMVLSERHSIAMPICRTVYRVLEGEIDAAAAYAGLLQVRPGHEDDPD